MPSTNRISPAGLSFAIAAYFLWGFLPVVFLLLAPSGAVEIVAWRVVLSLVFCVLLLTVTRGWTRFRAIMADRSAVLTLSLAAVFILVNWSVFIYATLSEHIVEAALGYFTNPIVTVLLGVIVLRERLRPAQWAAIGVSAIAVIVLAVGYGSFPWIALTLAFSFALYGLVKKRVGGRVDSIGGLTMETAVLAPVAVVALVIVGATTGITLGTQSSVHTVLMLSVGVVTAVPLLLFAAAARRIPLVYLGLVQFLAPIMQLITGALILHEPMPPERWIGFGVVWFALAILMADAIIHARRNRTIRAQANDISPDDSLGNER